MRTRKYNVRLTYLKDGTKEQICGKAERIMNEADLDFMFKAVSPLSSQYWLETIYSLGRNGSTTIREIVTTEDQEKMYKLYVITRI